MPVAAISHVLAGKPLSNALVRRICAERALDDLRDDLAQIAYGA